MIDKKPIKIAGFGKYLPQQVVSSEIEARHGLPQGWSERYSGVAARHHVTFESNGYMGARAIEHALENCQISLSEIDMILSAAATYDYPIPNQASITKSELKNGHSYTMPTIDLDSTCLSFVSAFEFAARLLDGKQYKTIVIVSSEIASFGLNPADWEILTLFGDGAVAVVVQYDEQADSAFIKGGQRTYSEGVYDTMVKGGGMKYFIKDHPYTPEMYSFAMNGRNLLRLAKNRIPAFMDWFFEDLPMVITDVDVIVPHQASRTGIHLFKNMYPFAATQVKETLSNYGNCIAASIPLTLYDAVEKGEIKRGDTCLLTGTSAGFSIGAVLIVY